MEKRIAGLLGAVATLGAMTAAQAAPTPQVPTDTLKANSFAELLEPIPNAAATLRAVDEQTGPSAAGNVELAQYYYHHHHHHHFWRRWHHHHHHHHWYYRRGYYY